MVESPFLPICSLETLVASLLQVAPHYFEGKAMEAGGINLTLRTYIGGGAFYREIALSVFNKAIKKHQVRWGGKTMEKSHVMMMTTTFYRSSGYSF